MGNGGIAPLVFGHLHTPLTLLLGKDPFTLSVGGWVSPNTYVDIFENRKYFASAGNRAVTLFSNKCTSH